MTRLIKTELDALYAGDLTQDAWLPLNESVEPLGLYVRQTSSSFSPVTGQSGVSEMYIVARASDGSTLGIYQSAEIPQSGIPIRNPLEYREVYQSWNWTAYNPARDA